MTSLLATGLSVEQKQLLRALFVEPTPDEVPVEVSPVLFAFALEHRLLPYLIDPIADGRVVLDASIGGDEIDEAIAATLAGQLRVEMALVVMADVLYAAGIDFRVLKGLATAHLDHANPALRSFGDVDLLVHGEDIVRTIEMLIASELGSFMTVRGGDGGIQHAVTFVVDGVEVDIHHRLLHQAAGHLTARFDLFADPDQFEVNGRTLAALPSHLRLLQAAGQNVLSSHRDRKISSDIDIFALRASYESALEAASEVGLGWMLQAGVARSMHLLGWEQALGDPARGVRGRLFEKVYGSGSASTIAVAGLEFLCAPVSVSVKIARSIVLPGDDYLERRGRSPLGQLAHQARRIMPWRHRRS